MDKNGLLILFRGRPTIVLTVKYHSEIWAEKCNTFNTALLFIILLSSQEILLETFMNSNRMLKIFSPENISHDIRLPKRRNVRPQIFVALHDNMIIIPMYHLQTTDLQLLIAMVYFTVWVCATWAIRFFRYYLNLSVHVLPQALEVSIFPVNIRTYTL